MDNKLVVEVLKEYNPDDHMTNATPDYELVREMTAKN